MSNQPGDSINVGDIAHAQGIAIGRHASARVIGSNVAGSSTIDALQLRAALEALYTALGQAHLPLNMTISTQTAVGSALVEVKDDQGQSDAVVQRIETIGDTLKQANVVVGECAEAGLVGGAARWGSSRGCQLVRHVAVMDQDTSRVLCL